jgi:two-component system sensor kinase FixL
MDHKRPGPHAGIPTADQQAPTGERLTPLLESTSVVPWQADGATRQFTSVGPQAERLLGYPCEAWYERDFWTKHIHPDDRESAVSLCLRQSKRSPSYDIQYRMLAKDGRQIWVHDVVNVQSVDGVPKTLTGFLIDITTQKETAVKAQTSEALFRGILESAPDAMIVADDGGHIALTNTETERMFDYASRELVGQDVDVLLPERFRGRHSGHQAGYFAAPKRRAMGEGLDLYGARKDGTEFPVEISLSPLVVEGRKLVICVIRDVTYAKRARANLRKAQAQSAAAQALAHVGSWEWTRQRGVVRRSDETNRIFGVATGSTPLLDETLEFLRPSDRDIVRKRLADAIAGTQPYDIEFSIVRPDGSVRVVHSKADTMLDEAGTVVGLTGMIQDITERVQAERHARQSLDALAHAGRVSTMGELTASLAHELKQPLTAILSNAQAGERFLSMEHPDLNELREILADIVKDDRRAGEVIRRLRTLLGNSGPTTEHVLNLNQVVAEVLPLIRSDIIIRELRIITEFDSSIPDVTGDRVQLQQVVLNLLLNGAEAMASCHDDTCRLVVRTGRHGAQGVAVSVQDCGTGVSEENREQLFTPFYTTKTDGMGMGLSIARSIVEQHNGRIWAVNNPDRGATFSFSLPAATAGEV